MIVFEGWLLGLKPQSAEALATPVNRLERDHDQGGNWRLWCNDELAHYAQLWQRLHWLCWLNAPDFGIVPDWRWRQQSRLQQSRPRHTTMHRAQVETFVLAFERITRLAQDTLAGIADEVVELDARRRLIRKR